MRLIVAGGGTVGICFPHWQLRGRSRSKTQTRASSSWALEMA